MNGGYCVTLETEWESFYKSTPVMERVIWSGSERVVVVRRGEAKGK